MLPAQPNQSLIDGLACLQALASAGRAVGSREMARELKLEPTRVNRLLKTLAHLGIAQQTDGKQYTPGPAMHVLAAQAMFGSGLLHRAMEPLETLRKFKLSVAMGVLWRDHVSYLYHGGPTTKAAEALGRVGLFPATRSSIGMVLLSRLSTSEVRGLYAGQLIPNFKSIAELLAELGEVRRTGYAVVQPFPENQTRTLAVAVDGEAVAVAMSGQFADRQIEELADALKDVASSIGKREVVMEKRV
jgi:DNA-binding IclR family transcriptional regulator